MNFTSSEQQHIAESIRILESHFRREPLVATNPDKVKGYCRLQIGALDYEVFGVCYLDTAHQLILFNKIFRGTLNSAWVYPRDVAKEALMVGAAAIILTHNHPSGLTTPSEADKRITDHLRKALELFDIRVLDHIIVSPVSAFSFAENGLL